jgi:molybdopterin/thiamine biosynthesis adenylyltransferase
MKTALRIAQADYERLRRHLFREDCDEYGAVILAGVSRADQRVALLCRELHLLDADEFPEGEAGYRQFSSATLARFGARAETERLALITCHSHPRATTHNGLSADDRAGHRKVFPHLLSILDGQPVAGVAFGSESAAGELWLADQDPQPLDVVEVVGNNRLELHSEPPPAEKLIEQRFDRQARMFGATGQARLRVMEVAVVGLGGGGSMLVEQLAHLGVGRIVGVDFDVIERHNLSRIVGACEADAQERLKKVAAAERLVSRIDPSISFTGIDGDIADQEVAQRLRAVDVIFLATDTITSRLVANAIAASQLIPLIQIGAKIDLIEGEIESVYVAVRPVMGGEGCLACAGLIDPATLQREAASEEERRAQNYLGIPEVVDPSVVTLNGIAASAAAHMMLMWSVGLAGKELVRHRIFDAREGNWLSVQVARRANCRWCGIQEGSHFARGDEALLPVRIGAPRR